VKAFVQLFNEIANAFRVHAMQMAGSAVKFKHMFVADNPMSDDSEHLYPLLH
jgi:hypothetical protein